MSPSITVKPLAADLRDDYFGFFEGEAFSDNPGWASCYCYFSHAPHATENWDARTSPQNRQAVAEMIAAGTQRGYLAYLGDAEFERAYESEAGRGLENLALWELAAAVRPMYAPDDWETMSSPRREVLEGLIVAAAKRAREGS